jgi:hypothetical protein
MTNYLKTHTIEARSTGLVNLTEGMAQISFFEGGHSVHHMLISRPTLERLGRDIAAALKSKRPPSERP